MRVPAARQSYAETLLTHHPKALANFVIPSSVVKINRRFAKMASKFTDKLEDVRNRLGDIHSSAEALREALNFSEYEPETFTGAANLIADDIEGVTNGLRELVREMISA